MKRMQEFDHIILIKGKKKIEREKYALLFISNTFISNTQGNTSLNLAKNQEVKLLLSENYSLSSSPLLSKNNAYYSLICIIYYIIKEIF